jgi:nucleotide-binding universal stress UspA family protein
MAGFRVIVAGTDGSSLAEQAVAQAARIAAHDGAELHLVTAFPDAGAFRERLRTSAQDAHVDLRAVAEDALDRASAHIRDLDVEATKHLIEADPAEALVKTAQETGADLLVVGNRGLSRIERFTMGSVSHKVFHHAPCSVMVVKGA